MNSLNIMIMEEIQEFYDEILGEKYTGWNAVINYNGTLEDIDEDEHAVLMRVQGNPSNSFIYRVRSEPDRIL